MGIRLGEICQFQSGGTPSRKCPEYFNGDIPWVTTTALNGGTISFDDANELITLKAIEESAAKLVPAHSILVGTRVGVGKAAINLIPMSTSQDIISLTAIDEHKWYKEFICRFISSKHNYLVSKARGATIKGIKIETLADLEIPEISIPEQHFIVTVFDKLNFLISSRKQQLAKLDELVKARFVEMFGDRFINDKQWNTSLLSECVSFHNGKAHEQVVDDNGEYILVTSKAIATDFKDVRKTNALLYPLNKHDIVMVMSDVPNGRALAKCQLIERSNKFTLNQRICSFDNYDFNPLFLLHLLNRHKYFLDFNDGNGQTNLRKDDILNCVLIVPPNDLQNQFAAFVEQIDKSKVAVQKALDEAQTLFDSLMQQYFG